MLIDAKTLQDLIWRADAQQRQNEQIARAAQAGDNELAHFYSLPPEQQATLYAQEAIADATEAARVGDVNGLRQGIRTAVEKAVYQGAQLVPQRHQPPRRKRGR